VGEGSRATANSPKSADGVAQQTNFWIIGMRGRPSVRHARAGRSALAQKSRSTGASCDRDEEGVRISSEDGPQGDEAMVIVARSVRGEKATRVRSVYQLFVDPDGELEYDALVRSKPEILQSVEKLLGTDS
jgi:hypothetical protein